MRSQRAGGHSEEGKRLEAEKALGCRLQAGTKSYSLCDKLLLCCSERSLQSSWVEDEIAAAIKKEREKRRDVLVPLNLDGYFFKWTGDHSIRVQERLAADFTGWEKDNAKFEREFEKVVEALRARS